MTSSFSREYSLSFVPSAASMRNQISRSLYQG
jgi:hypothetical protein